MAKKKSSQPSTPAGARATRLVACPECGVQMPQRYLAAHRRQHGPAADEESPYEQAAAEESAAKEAGGSTDSAVPEGNRHDNSQPGEPSQPQRPLDGPAASKEQPGMLVCPACAAFVAEDGLTLHMQERHVGWCPLCHTNSANLAGHLQSRHHMRPILPAPPYGRNWQARPRFTCMWCKKDISVWAYPRHEQPHHLR
jgi:hypothetical protein